MMDTGLLIIRLIIGLTFAAHGTQKLFGWFGGHGIAGTGGWFESIGMKPGKALAITAGLAELIGGLLFAGGAFPVDRSHPHHRFDACRNRQSTRCEWLLGDAERVRIQHGIDRHRTWSSDDRCWRLFTRCTYRVRKKVGHS